MRSVDAKDYQALPQPVAVMTKDFAAGDTTGWHSHPRIQFLYAASGLMTATTASGAWMVPEGHALLIPAGLAHSVTMHGAVVMRTAYLSADALAVPAADCRVLRVSHLLNALIGALGDEPVAYDLSGRGGHLAALIADEIARAPVTPFALPMPRDARLQSLCRSLIDNPGAGGTLDARADEMRMSRRTFTRRFRDETGLSFGEWRGRARVAAALERLARGEAMPGIARALGYDSPRSLQAMIQRKIGPRPGK